MDKIEQINECDLIKIKCHKCVLNNNKNFLFVFKQFLFFLNKFDKPKILF